MRAFCLEYFEILDAVDTPDSRTMIANLHETHRWVDEILAAKIEG